LRRQRQDQPHDPEGLQAMLKGRCSRTMRSGIESDGDTFSFTKLRSTCNIKAHHKPSLHCDVLATMSVSPLSKDNIAHDRRKQQMPLALTLAHLQNPTAGRPTAWLGDTQSHRAQTCLCRKKSTILANHVQMAVPIATGSMEVAAKTPYTCQSASQPSQQTSTTLIAAEVHPWAGMQPTRLPSAP
jgi:hypothetical protein